MRRDDPIDLHAQQLWANWGFADGELLQDYLETWGVDQFADLPGGEHADRERSLYRALLIELVQRSLLPALPERVSVEFYSTHNPIRFDTGTDHGPRTEDAPAWAARLSIKVSQVAAFAVLKDIWGPTDLPPDRFGRGVAPPTGRNEIVPHYDYTGCNQDLIFGRSADGTPTATLFLTPRGSD